MKIPYQSVSSQSEEGKTFKLLKKKKKKKTLIITLIISIQHISVSVQAWWQFYSSESRFTAPAEWFTVLDQRYCHNKFFWQKSTQTKWHKTTSDFGNVHFIFSSCFFFFIFSCVLNGCRFVLFFSHRLTHPGSSPETRC